MNRKDVLDLVAQDDRNRIEEEKAAIDTILDGPMVAQDRIKDPFQYTEVESGANKKQVFHINVPANKALIVKQIANEWYPQTTFELEMDHEINKHQRVLSDPEDPLDTNILVRDNITWRVTNEGPEDRTIGILTDGFYIPMEVYENIRSAYKRMGGDIGPIDLRQY